MKTNSRLDTDPYFVTNHSSPKGFPKIFYEYRFCKRFGINHAEYLINMAKGLKYCTKHYRWEPKENFYEHPSHGYACKEWICKNVNKRRKKEVRRHE
jgi:hypothetical protein